MAGTATKGLLVGLSRLGLDLERLCAPVGVRPSELMAPEVRVDPRVAGALLVEAERLTGDGFIGVRVAQNLPLGGAGSTIGKLTDASETGLAALRHFARFSRLISGDFAVQLHEGESTVLVEFTLEVPRSAPTRLPMEMFMAAIKRILEERMMNGQGPGAVSFRHRSSGEIDPYQQFFGCAVEFDARVYSMRYALAGLRQPMIATERRAEARLLELAESELRLVAPKLTVAVGEQVRIAMEEQERPARASIAKRLGMGDRTFQRRLYDEGTTFRAVVDQERRNVALSMLREPGCRVVDVAVAVGFDDATSFTKAFRRWTGKSPSNYQARVTKRDDT